MVGNDKDANAQLFYFYKRKSEEPKHQSYGESYKESPKEVLKLILPWSFHST